MYLQDGYQITTTTDLEVLKSISCASNLNLIILDAEPSEKVENLCKEIKLIKPEIPIILTYVFKNQIKDVETKIRKYVNSIFYKPFDLNEVSMKLSSLMI